MPGFLGLVQAHQEQPAGLLLRRMGAALTGKDTVQLHLHEGPGIGLAAVRTEGVSGPALVSSGDGSITVLLEGEIYSYDEGKQGIAGSFSQSAEESAKLVLKLYQQLGEDFVDSLNGAFTVALWDQDKSRLILANDRLGLHPVYYGRTPVRLLFASGVRALLQDPGVAREVDPVALAQLFTFEYPLGSRTLVDSVSLLPPASLLTFCRGRIEIRSYWTLGFEDRCEDRTEDSYVEEFHTLLRQAVRRQMSNLPSGILLSGGLDSRLLLALLAEHSEGREPVRSFTFGLPGCTDGRMARAAAARAGTHHRFHPLRPDYLLHHAQHGVRITDGQESVVHMHAIANLDLQTEHVKVLYKGYLGDALTGGHLHRDLWADYHPETLARKLFEQTSVIFKEPEHAKLFSPEFYRQVRGAAFDTFRASLAESSSQFAANRQNYFDLRERQRRFILNGVELVRSAAHVRTPFCDKDLVEFMLTVPPGLRLGRYLAKKFLIRYHPELAKVPCTDTGFPLVPCGRDLLIRIDRQLRWRLQSIGLRRPWKVPYANYPEWFRTSLRAWVEATLLDNRAMERGYFNPRYVKALITEHMEGKDHSNRLGLLLSFELWHRHVIDKSLDLQDPETGRSGHSGFEHELESHVAGERSHWN